MPLSVTEFASEIKEKYPVYKDIGDEELARLVIEKYPVYGDQIEFSKPSLFEIGKMTLPILAKERFETGKEFFRTPLTRRLPVLRKVPEALEEISPEVIREEPKVTQFGVGATKGLVSTAESLTTPENLALMVGAMKIPFQAGKRLFSGGFGALMGKEAIDLWKQTKDAWEKDDTGEWARLGTEMIGAGAFSIAGFKHAASRAKVKPVEIEKVSRKLLPAPEEKPVLAEPEPIFEIKERGLPILQPPRPEARLSPAPESIKMEPTVIPLERRLPFFPIGQPSEVKIPFEYRALKAKIDAKIRESVLKELPIELENAFLSELRKLSPEKPIVTTSRPPPVAPVEAKPPEPVQVEKAIPQELKLSKTQRNYANAYERWSKEGKDSPEPRPQDFNVSDKKAEIVRMQFEPKSTEPITRLEAAKPIEITEGGKKFENIPIVRGSLKSIKEQVVSGLQKYADRVEIPKDSNKRMRTILGKEEVSENPIRIEVPDDGIFTIEPTKNAVDSALKNIKKQSPNFFAPIVGKVGEAKEFKKGTPTILPEGLDIKKVGKRYERGAVLNPAGALLELGRMAKESKTYIEFREKMMTNRDLLDTARFYKMNLNDIYEQNKREEQPQVFAPTTALKAEGAVSPETLKRFMSPKQRESMFRVAGRYAEEILTPISARLNAISPEILIRTRKHAYREGVTVAEDMTAIEPFLEKAKTLSDAENFRITKLLNNGDFRGVEETLKRKGMQKDFEDVHEVLNRIFSRAKMAGVKIEERRNYFPRGVKDYEGLISEFGAEAKTAIETAVNKQAQKMGVKPEELSIEVKGKIADSLLRGWSQNKVFLSDPKYAKAREIESLTDTMASYYDPFDKSLVDYVIRMNQAIEANNFFKKTRKINEEPESVLSREYLDNSIGDLVAELKEKGEIKDYRQEIELRSILKDYFQPAIQGRAITGLRNFTYLLTLGNPVSGMTQLQSIGITVSRDGMARTAKKALTSKEWKLTDIGVNRARADFERHAQKGRITEFSMKPLEFFDVYDKELNLNSNWDRFRSLAKKNDKNFVGELERIFGKEDSAQVLDDIKNNRKTFDTGFFMFNELSKVHPISKLEVPQKFLSSSGGRLLYTLHTYQLKQLSLIRETIKENTQKGDYTKAAYDTTRLAFWLITSGVAVNTARDFILTGKTDELKDYIKDSAWQIALINRYTADRSLRDGIAEVLWEAPKPAIISVANDIQKDIKLGLKKADIEDIFPARMRKEIEEEKFRFPKYIPIVGKPYYQIFGRGADIAEREEREREKERFRTPVVR